MVNEMNKFNPCAICGEPGVYRQRYGLILCNKCTNIGDQEPDGYKR